MKRALVLSLAAAIALPLLADEAKTAEPKPAATAPAATTTDATAAPANESPIVAAAKRSKKRRAAGKATVITNETIKGSNGHISTAHTDRPVPKVPEPTPGPEQALVNQQAEAAAAAKAQEVARADEKRKADAAAEQKRAAGAALAEEGLYETLDGDPTTGEAAAEKASEPEQQKPPRE